MPENPPTIQIYRPNLATRRRLFRLILLTCLALALGSQPRQATGRPGAPYQPQVAAPDPGSLADAPLKVSLPVVLKPVSTLKDLVTAFPVTLPQPLAGNVGSWCTWGYCSIGPRLYHEPLADGRTLVGWTDASGNGHLSRLSSAGQLEHTANFSGKSVRGLVAHPDDTYAILLWDPAAKIMYLSKHNLDGSPIWSTSVDGSLTSFNPGIGDSRLAYGNHRYAAYFAVHGDSGWVQGHEGDALTYVDDNGVIIQPGSWEWGCSHSMAELVNFHPALNDFAPICSSDCYASKGILSNDSQVIYPSDGNCRGLVSAQLGGITTATDSWKLVFSALSRPGFASQGIGLATVNGAFQSSFVWLTDTNGNYERDPAIARLGASLDSNRFLVGWRTTDDGGYWLGVIDGSGNFLFGPENLSPAGVAWGERDDSFRTQADGRVTWVQGDPNSNQLTFYGFNGAAFLP